MNSAQSYLLLTSNLYIELMAIAYDFLIVFVLTVSFCIISVYEIGLMMWANLYVNMIADVVASVFSYHCN